MRTCSNVIFSISFLFFYFIYAVPLQSQQYAFLHYTVDDGLPSSNIYSIMQDSKGYIWFCSDMGISRFDGYTFKNITTADGLPFNDVWELKEDSEGRIWIYSYRSDFIYYKDGEIIQIENKEADDSRELIYNIKEDASKNIWLSTVENVYKYSPATSIIVQVKNSDIKKTASEFASEDFIIWDGTVNRIVNGEPEPYRSLFYPKKVKKNMSFYEKTALIHKKDTSIYITNNSFFFSLKDTLIKGQTFIDNCSDFPRFMGFYNGIYFFKSKERIITFNQDFEEIDDYHFLNDFDLTNLFIDQQQNIWIATDKEGVYMLPTKSFQTKTYKMNEDDYSVNAIVKDFDGIIWLGTKNGRIYYIKDKEVFLLDGPSEKRNKGFGPILDLHVSTTNKLYVIYQKSKLRVIDLDNINAAVSLKLYSSYRRDILEYTDFMSTSALKSFNNDFSDTLLTASNVGLSQWIKKDGVYYQYYYMTERSYAVQKDKDNNIWIGQPNGLFVYRDQKIDSLETLKKEYNFLGKNIKTIRVDSENNKWIGTDGYGLYVLRDNKLEAIPELINTIIKNVFIDTKDQAWVATNKGLVRVNKDRSVQLYTTAQGLASNEVNGVFVDDEIIYVGTNKGLSVIDEQLKLSSSFAPYLYIDKLYIRGVEQELNEQDSTFYFDLNYQQNSIKVDYTCLSYQSNKNIVYEYKMSGIDTTWQSTSQLNKEYPILPYGKSYTFQIRAKDINNRLSHKTYQFVFKIHPPWWETSWFRLFVLACIALYIYYHFNKFKEKEREKTAINKKFAELELQALQAQMNPHFVFNALQAIQDFVVGQDERAANRYMSNFSKLMRLFLESSKEKYISLEDELQLLYLYIELEQLRFEPPFDYKIDIPDNIDRSTIQIPSMLLQPFIENAINHGLRYKNSKGFIHILIEEEDNQLNIDIIDNGVGMKKAKEIKENATQSYKSRGMKIIEERLKSMQYIDDLKIEIEIKDRYENGKLDGTIVSLIVPFKDLPE